MPVVQFSTTGSVTGGAGSVSLTGVSSANKLILLTGCSSGSASNIGTPPTGYTAVSTPAAFVSGGTSTNSLIYYNPTPTNGTNTVTFSFTAGGSGPAILIEYSGMLTTPVDAVPTAVNATTATTSGTNTIATGTLAQADEVVFAVINTNTNGAGVTAAGISDPPAGFISLGAHQEDQVSSIWEACYAIVSSTASKSATWTWTDTASIFSQSAMASFKIAASAPSLPPGSIYT